MNNIKKSWMLLFEKSNIKEILNKLTNIKDIYLKSNIVIYPKVDNIFKCFEYFEINETKVVIIGQDPYFRNDQAIGLCFGTYNKPPPSLKNIANELRSDTGIILQDYSLINWAKQGVLLLNASLTVIEGKPGSNINLWREFTDLIINELNKSTQQIIFVAWGAFAHEKLKNVDTSKHHIIVSSHPSPLSAFKKYKTYSPFFQSKPFSKINNLLKNNNQQIIIW